MLSSHAALPEIGLLRVLDQLPGFLLTTDHELRVTAAHGPAFEEVDARPDEVIGRTLSELMADDPARELVVSVYRRVLGGRSDRFEYRLARTGRIYDTRVEPLRAEDGRIVGAAGLAIDVTERKQTEELFRSLFESTSVGITIGDLASHRPVRANGTFQRMVGRDEEELRRLTYDDISHPDDLPVLAEAKELLESGAVDSFRHEKRLVRPNGDELWIDLAVSAVPKPDGPPAYAVSVSTDVSERRRADAILAAVRATAEQLLQSDAFGVELPALLGRIGEATRASRVYVFDRHEAADGEPVWSQRYEWVAEGVRSLLEAPELQEFRYRERFGRWARAFERGEVVAGAVRSFPEGERALLEADGIRSMLVAPIIVAGDWVGYIGLDDCEREREWSAAEADALRAAARILGAAVQRLRANEALRESEARGREAQKLEAIGRVAGGIAHDFNNLLMIILGCSESALEELAPDSPVRGELEDIRDAAEQAATLTRGLLAFGRRQELQPVTVDLNDAVEAAAGMLRRLLPEDVRLELELELGLPEVRVDPAQLSQVILNLAVNARDAMPGGGRLTVATARDADAGFAVLTVADEGSGMAPEVAARAFEPFFTTKAPGRGTGLGLATVHGVVTQSGGRISVDSAPGAGTTVTVLLPRA
jgi:two-component system cell cycle sensor histidine kinase/response regulator CckA